MFLNTNSYSFDNLPKGKWRKKTFKFDIGDKVLVSFKSLKGSKLIKKPSVEGTYSRDQYVIKYGFLRNTLDNKYLVPGNTFYLKILLHLNFIFLFFSVYVLIDNQDNIVPGYFYKEQLIHYPKYGVNSRIR